MTTPLTLLLTITLPKVQTFTVNNPFVISEHHFEYTKTFLEHYEGFSFLLHTDDESLETANLLLRTISVNYTFISCYNGDYKDYPSLARPAGHKFANVIIFRDPWKFQPYLTTYRNVILYDVAIFLVFDQNGWSGFWEMDFIKFSGNVLIFNLIQTNRVLVYKKCYYCGELASSLQLLEDTTERRNAIASYEILPSKFNQFNRHLLNIGYLEFYPHMHCSKITVEPLPVTKFYQCLEYSGGEAQLVKVLSKKLNFTFNFVYDSRDSFNILENLINRTTDFAVGGLSVTLERFLTLTFTTSLRIEDFTLLYMYQTTIWDNLNLFMRPFSVKTWLVLLFTLAVLVALMWIAVADRKKNIGFCEIIFVCVKTMIEQNESKLSTKLFKTRWGPFILFFSLLFACMEINTAYKSKLSSIFVRPPHQEPNSVEELIADGYSISVDGDKLDFYSEMLSATDPILIFLKKKGILLKGFCSQVEYISKHRAAMMNELAILQYYIRYMCPDKVYPRVKTGRFNPDKLRITSKPIRSNPHAWILQPAVPFWKAFDVIIGQLKNGGFLDKWTRDALMDLHHYKGIPYSKNNFPEDDYASLNTYSSSFLIYAIGILISMFAFVAEICMFTINKKKQRCLDPKQT